jgi:hypothetical protein
MTLFLPTRRSPTSPTGPTRCRLAVAERDRDTLRWWRRRCASAACGWPSSRSCPPATRVRPVFYEGLARILDPPAARSRRPTSSARSNARDRAALDPLARTGAQGAARGNPWRSGCRSTCRPAPSAIRAGCARSRPGCWPTPRSRRLILEITESSAMLIPDIVSVFMADLQARGVRFALDDFGQGFTSFRYLRDFDFDILKIDGQFIRGVAGIPTTRCSPGRSCRSPGISRCSPWPNRSRRRRMPHGSPPPGSTACRATTSPPPPCAAHLGRVRGSPGGLTRADTLSRCPSPRRPRGAPERTGWPRERARPSRSIGPDRERSPTP